MRNRLGFMVLGLCNNFSFSIMLSAANDLMAASGNSAQDSKMAASVGAESSNANNINSSDFMDGFEPFTNEEMGVGLVATINGTNGTGDINSRVKLCNPISTSAVLLADIIPALIIQTLYPIALVKLSGHLKVCVAVALAAASFVTTGYSSSFLPIMVGTCAASVAYGLGESTFLSSSVRYGPGALIGWSVGTGFAGMVSASSYAVLRTILPIGHTMCMMLVLPLLMFVTYYLVLIPMDLNEQEISDILKKQDNCKAPATISSIGNCDKISIKSNNIGTSVVVKLTPNGQEKSFDADNSSIDYDKLSVAKLDARQAKDLEANGRLTSSSSKNLIELDDFESFGFVAKLRFSFIDLAPFFIPMATVYFSAYFINQGLTELFYFEDFSSLTKADQYRWLQVAYQLGSLLSRCSILFFRFPHLWLMASLQPINLALVMAHSLRFIELPGFLCVVALVFYEGLITGFCYSNTYYNLREYIELKKQPLAISVVAVFNSVGVLMAALLALPTHNKLCDLYQLWNI